MSESPFVAVSMSNEPVILSNVESIGRIVLSEFEIDLVFHLGDYIYEGAGNASGVRQAEPTHTCATLADSLYSNAGGELSTALPCGFSDHAASASSGQAIHSASILSAHAEFDGQKLRVNVLEHYK